MIAEPSLALALLTAHEQRVDGINSVLRECVVSELNGILV